MFSPSVCLCLWIHSPPQSSNERPALPPSPSPQSLLCPSWSPPVLLSLFITIWTTVCRLLSFSTSPCCSFYAHVTLLMLRSVFISLYRVRSLLLNSTPAVFPVFSHSSLFPVQSASPRHTALLTYDSEFLHAIQLIHSFCFTI